MTSTRTELFGLLACMICLHRIHNQVYSVKNVPIYTDSECSINLIKQYRIHSTATALSNVIDVVIEAHKYYNMNKKMFDIVHVHGHQDKKMSFDQFDIPSQANVRMDRKAGAFISQMIITSHTHHAPILPSQSICITHKKHIVTSSIREHLINFFNLDQRQQ